MSGRGRRVTGIQAAADLRVERTPEASARVAAGVVVEALRAGLDRGPRARWVLAGGTTPLALYRLLAEDPEALDWSRVDFFWGDERCVEPTDPASNYRMAREALLDPLGIEPDRCFRIEGELAPAVAAERYGRRVAGVLERSDWDLVLLGLGGDGHTASLFPPRPTPEEEGWVVATEALDPPRRRVSMTLAALARTRRTLFLVAGASKSEALADVLGGVAALHASALLRRAPRVTWCVDRAAAARVRAIECG